MTMRPGRTAALLFAVAALMASCTYLPLDAGLASGVAVAESREAIIMTPAAGPPPTVGLIFYPGAFVDPHAYVSELSAVTAAGIPVVIAKLAGNLAVLSIDAGLALRGSVPGVTRWVIGGHSLGGAMAAWSVSNNPDAYIGLVLLAAYPGTSASLASWAHPVLSLSASNDGLATPQKVTDAAPLLPTPQASVADTVALAALSAGTLTVFHQIPGGNHAQFGSYGAQDGDQAATISPAAQHAEVADFVTAFFSRNGW